MVWLLLFFALLAGMMLPLQTGVNSQLARLVGNSTLAATISFLVGTLALLLYSVVLRLPLPAVSEVARAPFWIWTGGLLGAFFIVTTTTLAAKMSITVMVGLIIAGQMLVSLVLDHYGLLGFPVQPISLWRVVGVLLLLAGVVLIRKF
jgi:bacterial/archaeal transporter family-2 protein